jgi:uncharacterized protein (DUF362 family)
MSKHKFHPIYSKDASVYLEGGPDKFTALQRAIDTSKFLDNVEAVLAQSGKARQDFLIAIKPNIMTASKKLAPNPVYTDPELVEAMVECLFERGYRNMAVVEARNVFDYSYQGRGVKAVAEMVGYKGGNYRIEDLSEQKEPFDYGGVLGMHSVGRTWRDADYRISFAKNKSHWQCFYTGCLKNIYGTLPEWDKMKHYHGKKREFYECCILALHHFPVHFGFLDAWVSGDGFSGHVRDANPNMTKTIFASENVYALDWVMGEKMELNPSLNYVLQEAMFRWGPIEITRVGNMTSWANWRNLRPFVILALDAIEEAYWTSRIFSRSFASEQDERFPPVTRWQFLFGLIQRFTRLFESLVTVKTRGGKTPAAQLVTQKSI